MGAGSEKASEYIEHLPQIFRKKMEGEPSFLGQYLKIFEALVSGRDDAYVIGLEERIAGFENYLDSGLTPVEETSADGRLDSEFLNYLAGWVALVFDQNWELDKRREWLRKIVPLYKKRGTKSGLTEYLNMFVGNQVSVEEPPGGFIVGEPENSTVGVNTFIAGAPAYFFRVKINYGYPPNEFRIDEWKNLRKGSETIVDLEKPAHTYYHLDACTNGIQVAVTSTIGKDTLIWKESKRI
jgi:phage tail-like protein